jgi:hypothetical protein
MALLDDYLLPLIVGLSAILAFFIYSKTKKKGFLLIGTALAIQVAFNVTYFELLNYNLLFSGNDYLSRANLISTLSFTFALIFSLLLFSGLIVLYTEFKPKVTQKIPTEKI